MHARRRRRAAAPPTCVSHHLAHLLQRLQLIGRLRGAASQPQAVGPRARVASGLGVFRAARSPPPESIAVTAVHLGRGRGRHGLVRFNVRTHGGSRPSGAAEGWRAWQPCETPSGLLPRDSSIGAHVEAWDQRVRGAVARKIYVRPERTFPLFSASVLANISLENKNRRTGFAKVSEPQYLMLSQALSGLRSFSSQTPTHPPTCTHTRTQIHPTNHPHRHHTHPTSM